MADDPQAPRRRTPRRNRDPSAEAASSGADDAASDAVDAAPDVDDPGEAVTDDLAPVDGEPTSDDTAAAEIDEDAPIAAAREGGALEAEATEAPDVTAADDAEPLAEDDGPVADDAGPMVDAAAPAEPAAAPAEPDEAGESEPTSEPGVAATRGSEATDDEAAPVPVAAAGAATATASLWESDDGTPTASLPWLQARSPDDAICPFLRAVTADDRLAFPIESPDPANRCASMHEAVPQSLRQQELVCLTANHTNCPRYLRGAALTGAVLAEAVEPSVRPKALLTPAISAALIILAMSFGASVVFGVANGGLAMPSQAAVSTTAPSTSTGAVAASASPSPASTPRATASAVASANPSAGASATPSPSPSVATTPSPTPIATPRPTAVAAGATPVPKSSRYKLLKPCPNKPNCYIYTVRSGDNLFSIAKYFGVPLSTVKRLNPWTKTQSLRAGKQLILPPPKR